MPLICGEPFSLAALSAAVVQSRDPHCAEEAPLPATPFILPRLWHRVAAALRLWGARDFERRYLATLNDSQLWDMRLSRRDVREEAAKPFWRA